VSGRPVTDRFSVCTCAPTKLAEALSKTAAKIKEKRFIGLLQPQIEVRFRSVTVPFRVWCRI